MLVFESETSEEHEALSDEQVYERWGNGDWQVKESSLGLHKALVYEATPGDLRSLPEDERKDVTRKHEYIQKVQAAIEARGSQVRCDPDMLTAEIQKVSRSRGDKVAPHWSTWWRWWSRFRSGQCLMRLGDQRNRSGRRTDTEGFSVFEEVIQEVFLTQQKHPAKAVVDGVRERYSRINNDVDPMHQRKTPSQATIYRWLASLHYGVVLAARQGKRFAERELRAAIGTVTVRSILDRVEIDHTPVDLLVVCEATRMVLGRPWLTLAIDRKSRMICGFYISFHAPSASSVLYCMRMAILPKGPILKAVDGSRNPWPVRGMPKTLVADNGMDLHSKALEAFCLEGLIEQVYCGAGHPELKGAIERMFRTLSSDLFHVLPGTVFSNVLDRADYAAEKLAAIDLKVLTHLLIKWIVDVYHCTPHRGLRGKTPLQVWQEEEVSMAFELPAYPRQFDMMIGHIASRTLFHYGVEYDSIRYNSAALQTFGEAHANRELLELRVYEHDVSYVDVMNPKTREFIRVPAIDQDYCQGLNRHTHTLLRQLVRSRFKDTWTQEQLRLAKAEIQDMVGNALRAHKAGKRKERAAKVLHDSEQVLGTRPTQALDAAMQSSPTDLEKQDLQLFDTSSIPLPKFGSTLRQGGIA
jgi:putative transposase